MNSKKKYKILITDDAGMNREFLDDILGEEYDITEMENGAKTVFWLEENRAETVLVLLGITMPMMKGFEVLACMNRSRWIDDMPVMVFSSDESKENMNRAYELGVVDYICRPFDEAVVMRRIVNLAMLCERQHRLIESMAEQMHEKTRMCSLMVSILSHVVEFRNGENGLHVLHIGVLTEMLLKRLAQVTDRYQLDESAISLISTASALHDIGKIVIPGEILNKPGRLTEEEFEVIKGHSLAGAAMLSDLPFYNEEPLVKKAFEVSRWHHERYDGRGYPDGLKGEEIPLAAQVVALADVYDALTNERCYKKAFSHEEAMEMILEGQCGEFNPLLLQCLQDIEDMVQKEFRTGRG